MVIARRILGVNGKATGSEVAVAPAFIVIDALLLNFKEVIVEAVTALLVPSGETAMFTEFMVTGVEAVLFEKCTRSVSPPIEMRTI